MALGQAAHSQWGTAIQAAALASVVQLMEIRLLPTQPSAHLPAPQEQSDLGALRPRAVPWSVPNEANQISKLCIIF